MNFWKNEKKYKLYDLKYEKLIGDQENQTKYLIKHLGLKWESECLSPHKNEREIYTASVNQVRNKVYKGSSRAWQKYKPFIDDRFNVLISASD